MLLYEKCYVMVSIHLESNRLREATKQMKIKQKEEKIMIQNKIITLD